MKRIVTIPTFAAWAACAYVSFDLFDAGLDLAGWIWAGVSLACFTLGVLAIEK